MIAPSPPEKTDLPDHIKKLGAPQVRLMLSVGQIAPQLHRSAIRWLAEQDQKKESSDGSRRRLDRTISVISAAAAIIAAMAAIVAAIITAMR